MIGDLFKMLSKSMHFLREMHVETYNRDIISQINSFRYKSQLIENIDK